MISRLKYFLLFFVFLCVFGGAFLWISARMGLFCKPEVLVERFFENDVPESCIIDVLILSGDKTCPMLNKLILDRDIPRRGYAILFLGIRRFGPAIPNLIKIIEDQTEPDYIRGNALISVYQMAPVRAKALAKNYGSGEGRLAQIAGDVRQGLLHPKERSFFSALFYRDHVGSNRTNVSSPPE